MAVIVVGNGALAPSSRGVNFVKAPCYKVPFNYSRLVIKHKHRIFDTSRLVRGAKYKKERTFFCKISSEALLNIGPNYGGIKDVERAGSYNDIEIGSTAKDVERGDDDDGSLQRASIELVKPTNSAVQSVHRFLEGIVEMSRLQNYVPSMALVFVGAWIGGGRSFEALMRPGQVWIAAGCSAVITVASMLANDIFDFRSGTDQANGKTSPLLRGQVHPYHVELVAGCLYGASVIGLCYLEPMSLRLLIGASAVATYIYTPFFKHLTMVKNVVVSGVISSSILAGALAIGGQEQLQNPVVTAVALFFFLCVLSRELLMDVADMVGDKAAGVNTLAVRFGGQIGTLTASFCLAAANALLISLLAVKAQAFATIGTLILLPLHAKILALCKDLGATKDALAGKSIQQIVHQSMVHIGFGVLVLATAA